MTTAEAAPDGLVANNEVGISLMAGEEADAIVDLLKEELGDQLQVTDCITYLKLETSVGQIELDFADVAEALGHRFDLGDFQVIFSSYYGRPMVTDTMIGVYSDMSAGVVDSDPAPSA
jgi:hypothetical protein